MAHPIRKVTLEYKAVIERVDLLPWCALVATAGRTGVDFLQSLFDSHPEVLGFNGFLLFDRFWKNSYCANYPGKVNPSDLVDEFVGHFLHKLKSRYDFVERKDKLGDQQNESIETNLDQFREDLTQLISTRSISARNVLQSVYVAYALSLGEDLGRKKLFLHNLHHIWKLDSFLKDFPDSQILAITRDPRASYVSGYEHHARFDPTKDTADRVFSVLGAGENSSQKIRERVCSGKT